jgi:hypothetical protein
VFDTGWLIHIPCDQETFSAKILSSLLPFHAPNNMYVNLMAVKGGKSSGDPRLRHFFIYTATKKSHHHVAASRQSGTADGRFEVYVGGGEPCLPSNLDGCGDGRGRGEARLVYPKGLVFSRDNQLIFVDGSTVRLVEGNTLRTLAGERELEIHTHVQ